MRAISMLMKDRDFKAIPAQFRNMKRIWAGKPKKGGLLIRRELEAQLFEIGLTQL